MSWAQNNREHLEAALARNRYWLYQLAARRGSEESNAPADTIEAPPPEVPASSEQPSALEVLTDTFGLSPFERDLLVLVAASELDLDFGGLAAAAQGDPDRQFPSFGLALQALPEAHWSAFSPDAPLRHWRLLEVTDGPTVTSSPLRIEERVLHFLRGLSVSEERLAGLVRPLAPGGPLVASHRRLAESLVRAWTRPESGVSLPVIQLVGPETEGKSAITAAACATLGLEVSAIRAATLPTEPIELDGLVRLLGREAALGRRVLLLDCEGIEPADAARSQAIATFAERYRGALVLTSRDRRPLPPRRLSVPLEVQRPETAEQEALWIASLGEQAEALTGQCRLLSAQFDLSAGAIRAAGAEALSTAVPRADDDAAASIAGPQPIDPETLRRALWSSCLRQARPGLDALAHRLRPVADWEQLVLPEAQKATLAEIATHVRQRYRVYEDWGFAARSSRGLGITSLFAGPSGTGKTMAAEVLARTLEIDLYRIDLATVVSKYIGETEKNLKRIFDAAEAGGAILLFDEADALFGKRSEVKDSHDRYANIEVSYLLQRMEEYRGLAILTTNLKGALDQAFLRRIRFSIQFPFPDAAARAEIWRGIFPAQTPTRDLDPGRLARLAVAGGNIANIALGAAFLAAEDDSPVVMDHVFRAARNEYAKLEKPLTATELGRKR